MKRLFKRTHIEAVGAASDWFRVCDKALVAQLEPNPVTETFNLLIEYWPSQADKDADLAETLEQRVSKALAAEYPGRSIHIESTYTDTEYGKESK